MPVPAPDPSGLRNDAHGPGFWEDLAGRLYGQLIGLEDRPDSVDATAIHYFIDVRHCGLALEEIARTPAHHTIAVTDQERADMLALADLVDILARAHLTPRTDELVRATIRACSAKARCQLLAGAQAAPDRLAEPRHHGHLPAAHRPGRRDRHGPQAGMEAMTA